MSKKSKMYYFSSCYGKVKESKITYDEYESISHYTKNTVSEDTLGRIDDITWNDLDLDAVFLHIDHSNSSVGRDYLYRLLRTPVTNEEELQKRERVIRYFDEHPEQRTECEYLFDHIGFTKKIAISDHINQLLTLPGFGMTFHIIMNVLILASIAFAIFVNPVIGIMLILATVGTSIVSYYRTKNRVDSFFVCIRHFLNMLYVGHKVSRLKIEVLEEQNAEMSRIYSKFASVRNGAWLLTTGNNGSLADILLEYLRMITHADLMKFTSMLKHIKGNEADIWKLMECLGYTEAMISIASYRHTLPYYCLPTFTDNSKLQIQNVYHTAIKAPVANSIEEEGCVLITGSNASGKSTFLKSVAIAAVLAQTVHTVPAQVYSAPLYRIYSSMALQDNIEAGESYYIVEIKSLKRIVDAAMSTDEKASQLRILCFIDEVLRGTNTVERIAASTQVLQSLSKQKVTCFAATHDIELTSLLKKNYANYHFEEEFENNEIRFNYLLKKGASTSRNAIRLLETIGYDEGMIQSAQNMAEDFVKNGVWRLEE